MPNPKLGGIIVRAAAAALLPVLLLALLALAIAGCAASPGPADNAGAGAAGAGAGGGGSGGSPAPFPGSTGSLAPFPGSTPSSRTSDIAGTTTRTSDPSHRPFTPEEQEVADAYVAAMDAINQAAAYPVNPNHPALYATMTGEFLATVQRLIGNLQAAQQHGVVPTPSLAHVEVSAVELNGSTASIKACVVDDAQVVDSRNGSTVNSRVSTVKDDANLVRIEGHWKVARRVEVGRWQGAQTCE